MVEIPLSEFGLELVVTACARKGWAAKSVQNWVKAGLLPAVPVGSGRGTFLLRTADVDAFETPKRGRKPKAKPEKPKRVRKPKK